MGTLTGILQEDNRPSAKELLGPKPRKLSHWEIGCYYMDLSFDDFFIPKPKSVLRWGFRKAKRTSYSLADWGINKFYDKKDSPYWRSVGLMAAAQYVGNLIKPEQSKIAHKMNIRNKQGEINEAIFCQYGIPAGLGISLLIKYPLIFGAISAFPTKFDDLATLGYVGFQLIYNLGPRAYWAYVKKEPSVPLSISAAVTNLAHFSAKGILSKIDLRKLISGNNDNNQS